MSDSSSTFIQANGAVVLWRCARWANRQTLMDGLSRMGLEKFCPNKRSNLSCLADALSSVFAGADHDVQRLEAKDSYEVIRIKRGEERNDYTHVGRFIIKEENSSRQISMVPHDHATMTAVLGQFNKFLGYVRGEAVTECLVSLIYHWKGTCLKPGGGVYWLPEDRLGDWQLLGEVVRRASMTQTGRLYQMVVARDENTLRTVIDALTEEIDAEVASIDKGIASTELGSRALENRRAAACRLATKVEDYERMFSMPLPKLRQNLSRVELAAAQAALLATARVGV